MPLSRITRVEKAADMIFARTPIRWQVASVMKTSPAAASLTQALEQSLQQPRACLLLIWKRSRTLQEKSLSVSHRIHFLLSYISMADSGLCIMKTLFGSYMSVCFYVRPALPNVSGSVLFQGHGVVLRADWLHMLFLISAGEYFLH